MRDYFKFISNVHFILGKKKTFLLYKMVLLILVATILEVFGITLIIPALHFISDPEKLIFTLEQSLSSDLFLNILIFLKSMTIKQVGIIFFIFILFIFTFKFFFLILVAWLSSKFIMDIQKHVSEKLFNVYINQEYEFYLKSNSSVLTSTVLKESSVFAGTIMSSIITLITEGSIMIGFAFLLLVFNPQLSLILIAITGIIISLYYTLIKSKVKIWGKKRQDHDALKLKNLYQAFENFKIIKFYGIEKFFKKKFFFHNRIAADMDRNTFFLSKIPNIGMEYLVLILLVVAVIVIVLSSSNINELIIQLGVYVAVSFKILPSVNRSLNSITGLRYGSTVVNLIYNELNKENTEIIKSNKINEEDDQVDQIKFEKEIELKNVSFKYDDNKDHVLKDVSIKIVKNDFIGVVGESGSGKTTFLNIILTLLNSYTGKYLVDGQELRQKDLVKWRKKISFVPQEPYLIDDTLVKNIAFGIDESLINIERVQECLEIAQFNVNKKNLDAVIGEKGVQLSGGQKQRISIARALYNNPDIIIMDEPTSSLDIETEKKIIYSINELSKYKTILLVSHRKSVLSECNKIFEIKEKKIKLL